MARSGIPHTRIGQAVLDYLDGRYPGIVNDCIEYEHHRHANGEEFLTLKLLVSDRGGAEVPS